MKAAPCITFNQFAASKSALSLQARSCYLSASTHELFLLSFSKPEFTHFVDGLHISQSQMIPFEGEQEPHSEQILHPQYIYIYIHIQD